MSTIEIDPPRMQQMSERSLPTAAPSQTAEKRPLKLGRVATFAAILLIAGLAAAGRF